MASNSIKKIGAMLTLDGEKEFRDSVSKVNSDLKTMNSQLKLVSSEYQDNANSMAALTAKSKVLNEQQDLQKAKLKTLTDALENARKNQEKISKVVEEYKDKVAAANKELDDMKKSSSATDDELDAQKETIKKLNTELGMAEAAYEDAGKKVNTWQTKLNNSQVELNNLDASIRTNEKYMSEAEASTDKTAKSIDEYGNKVKDAGNKTSVFGDVLKANLTSEIIINGVKALGREVKEVTTGIVDAGVEFESAFTGVVKTVNATDTELAALRSDILGMSEDIPATTTEIAAVAEAAGQLGIQTENISEFTETMIAMGESTDLVSENASSELAKFANITKMSQDKFENLGSTVVDLGNNLATTESAIVDMGMNLASAGKQVGLSEAQIMSLAAGLSSVGMEAQAGGTAFSKLMLNIKLACETGGGNLKAFASVADMTTSQFKVAFEEDAAGAIMAFLKGLNDTERNGGTAISVLTDMEITETRLRDTILRASGATDLFNQALDIGSNAWEENIALTKEAETRYGTTESKIATMKNSVSELGITTYDRFKNSFAKGVDQAKESVLELNAEMAHGKLGDSVEKLGEKFGELTESVLDFGEDAIPVVCNGMSWIIDNGDEIISVIGGIGAGMATYKSYTLIVSAVNAYKEFKKAAESATVAQLALNVAENANPVGIMVAAVAGLAAGMAILYTTMDEGVSQYEKEAEAIGKSVEEINASTEALNDNLDARDQERTSLEDTLSVTDSYRDKLEDLMDKEGKSASDKLLIKEYCDKLNTSVEGLSLSYDEQTDSLNMSSEALDAYVDTALRAKKTSLLIDELAKNEIDLAKASENLNEANTTLSSAEKELTTVTKEHEEASEKLTSTEYSRMKGMPTKNKYTELAEGEELLTKKVDEASEAQKEAQEAVDALNEEHTKMQTILDDSTKAMGDTADATDDLTKRTVTFGDKTYTVTGETAARLDELNVAYSEAYAGAMDSIEGQIGLFETIDLKSELSIDNMITNLSEQATAMDTWAENLQKASQMGIDEGLLASLNDGTVESAAYLNEIVNNGNTKIDELNEAWKRTQDGRKSLAEGMTEVSTEYNKQISDMLTTAQTNASVGSANVGVAVGTGFIEGILSQAQSVYDTVTNVFNTVHLRAKGALESNSPSKKFIRIGKDVDNGAAIGIEENAEVAYAAVRDMSGGIISSAQNILSKGVGTVSGSVKLNAEADTTKTAAASIVNPTIIFQPQEMTTAELDRCFNYVNKKFGVAIG